MTPKPKPDDEPDAIDLEQDLGTRETDSNDEPAETSVMTRTRPCRTCITLES